MAYWTYHLRQTFLLDQNCLYFSMQLPVHWNYNVDCWEFFCFICFSVYFDYTWGSRARLASFMNDGLLYRTIETNQWTKQSNWGNEYISENKDWHEERGKEIIRAELFKAAMEVKSVGTFPVILLKLATPPLPPQTKLNLEQNGWNWVLFWPQHC